MSELTQYSTENLSSMANLCGEIYNELGECSKLISMQIELMFERARPEKHRFAAFLEKLINESQIVQTEIQNDLKKAAQ